MASFVADKRISSSVESNTSESHKRSLLQSSDILIVRPGAFTDSAYDHLSHSKAYAKTPGAQSTNTIGPEDYMQTKHIYPRQDQRDEWITKATIYTSRVGTNESDEESLSMGEGTDQAYEDQPRESESAFGRLHAMPEDRQYIMQRFLGEETYQPTRVLDESTKGLSYIEDEVGESMNPPPKRGQASLDTNFLMIGAFAEDFDEYEVYTHLKSVVYANSIHPISTDYQSLGPEAFAKEYLEYESCFSKPYEKPDKMENCSNSF